MEENILLPFPSDYDDKLRVSSLDPNIDVEIVNAIDTDHTCPLVDYIYRLPRVLSESETPKGVGAILFSNSARKKIEHSLSIYTEESDRVAYARVLPYIVDVVKGSILLEEHRDRKKNSSKKRLPENESDPNVSKIQRLYGAVSIDGELYRAKTTIQVFKVSSDQSRCHGYEVTKIELLNQTGSLERPLEVHQSLDSNSIEELLSPKLRNIATPAINVALNNSSISLAKLLKDVELSYEPGVKLLDAMEASHQFALTGEYSKMVEIYEEARTKRLSHMVADPLQRIRQTTPHLLPQEQLVGRLEEALSGKTEQEKLEYLSHYNYGVAKDEDTPIEILNLLSKDVSPAVRELVAGNPYAPIEILVRLSEDENENVRKAIAWNPSTPHEILECLSKDERAVVIDGVARNKSTPPQILASLSTDSRFWIREAVASNVSTPAEILEHLSKDKESSFVRQIVAWNPSTLTTTLSALTKDKEYSVSATAYKELQKRGVSIEEDTTQSSEIVVPSSPVQERAQAILEARKGEAVTPKEADVSLAHKQHKPKL